MWWGPPTCWAEQPLGISSIGWHAIKQRLCYLNYLLFAFQPKWTFGCTAGKKIIFLYLLLNMIWFRLCNFHNGWMSLINCRLKEQEKHFILLFFYRFWIIEKPTPIIFFSNWWNSSSCFKSLSLSQYNIFGILLLVGYIIFWQWNCWWPYK